MAIALNIISKLLFVIFLIVTSVKCANVLVFDSVPSPSHQIWMRALTKAIGTQHNVTFVTVGSPKNLGKNVTNIYLEDTYNELHRNLPASNLVELSDASPITEMADLINYCTSGCSGAFKSKEGLKLIMDYPDDFKFDVIIHDYSCGPCFMFIASKFQSAPVIGVTAFGMPPYTTCLFGGHTPYAYAPYYGHSYSTDMTFLQRANNMFMYFVHNAYQIYSMGPKSDAIVRQYLGNNFPSVAEMEKQRVVLGFVNTNPATDPPVPLPPNIIPIGGLHIESTKPLPQELENFVQSSIKGAVLFSLGTNIRSDLLGAEKQKILIQALGEIPEYNFLWKFESDTLPMKLPKNVIVRNFLPQSDLLAHPKVKAFISHGGQLSTLESTWYGKPMILIPFLADQHRNAYNLVRDGIAESIIFTHITKQELKQKVLAVLEKSKYLENMTLRSQMFRDQPEKPIDRALWWINYIIRNPNPKHLQSPVKRLGYFRANCYDIVLAVVGIVLSIVYLLYKIVNFCFRKKSVERKVKKH